MIYLLRKLRTYFVMKQKYAKASKVLEIERKIKGLYTSIISKLKILA